MYLLLLILLPLFVLLLILNYCRKKKIIKKVKALYPDEKCILINELLEPFGYNYIPSQDIFSTRIDAWQRRMGYCALYDKAAPGLNMIFDFLPVYFDFRNQTWLLEIWKGQYGINTGGEMGLYHADRILDETEYQTTLFQSVNDEDMLHFHFSLQKNESSCANVSGTHWWLTAFRLGLFSDPSDLSMEVSITFPNAEMAGAFVNGLFKAGYSTSEIKRYCNTISFTMVPVPPAKGFFRRLRIKIAQRKNLFWCKTYLRITNPFTQSLDRVLYLYYYLPIIFRKTLRIRKTSRRQKRL